MRRVPAIWRVIQCASEIGAFCHAHQCAAQPVLQGFAVGLDDRKIEQFGLPQVQRRGGAVAGRQFQLLLVEHVGATPYFPLHQPTPMSLAIGPADGARRDIQGGGQLPQGRQSIALVQHAVVDIARQCIGNRQIHRLAELA
ncbi:hypothetical protein D3C76_1427880 [compost metagenome]